MTGRLERAPLFTPEELVQATGGRLVQCSAPADRPGAGVLAVATDSRKVQAGSLFVPLAGSRTDGHLFLGQALRAGASALLIAAREWEGRREELRRLPEAVRVTGVVVEEPLRALQDLARYHVRRWPRLERIGVTGSSGKTTTKEILGAVFSREGSTLINEGNLNSEVGLPLAVFGLDGGHRFAILEMGINHPGEMDVLADVVRPDAALITNIGRAHLGPMGSMDAIAEEKKKIFRFFDGRQRAFLFEDEPYREILSRGVRGTVYPFGPRSTRGYQGSRSLGLDGTAIDWEGLQIRFPLFGHHNLLNALAALSVSAEWGISPSKMREGLEAVRPLTGRSQILRGEVTIIHDGYNANPDSVRRLLEFIRPLEWAGRKVAVLGSMLELGEASEQAHLRVGEEAGHSGLDVILLFGPEMEPAGRVLQESGAAGRAEWITDFDRLQERLLGLLRAGDLLLLKGSRGMELERLIPAVRRAGL